MKEIIAKSILSSKNHINLYRGCSHGCIYCDSRSEIYGKSNDFENIEVKVNALTLLEREFQKRRKKCMIMTGAMTDPYIPIEKKLEYTRRTLELIEKYGYGVSLITKSDLVMRDIDVLKRINDKTKSIVMMTLTTYDESICKIVEPNVTTTFNRFVALKELNKAGIETIVWITPILPFINDTHENIDGLLEYCKQANVKGIITFNLGLTLRKGNREYFFEKLDESFPNMKDKYLQKFGYNYGMGTPICKELEAKIKKFCKDNKMLHSQKEVFDYIHDFPEPFEQLSLF